MSESMISNMVAGASNHELLLCLMASLGLGFFLAIVYMFKNNYSKNFVVTLVLLPAIIQVVIMLVNGNLGAGVAVMGAFSLVRFRSAPGGAKEITSIFLAMAIGLATGMGYIFFAVLFTGIIGIIFLLLALVPFGDGRENIKTLKITLPEDMDYSELFDDIFKEYMKKVTLERVKLTSLGSLFEVQYTVVFKDIRKEKDVIDAIRVRNSNLPIISTKAIAMNSEL